MEKSWGRPCWSKIQITSFFVVWRLHHLMYSFVLLSKNYIILLITLFVDSGNIDSHFENALTWLNSTPFIRISCLRSSFISKRLSLCALFIFADKDTILDFWNSISKKRRIALYISILFVWFEKMFQISGIFQCPTLAISRRLCPPIRNFSSPTLPSLLMYVFMFKVYKDGNLHFLHEKSDQEVSSHWVKCF